MHTLRQNDLFTAFSLSFYYSKIVNNPSKYVTVFYKYCQIQLASTLLNCANHLNINNYLFEKWHFKFCMIFAYHNQIIH